MQLLESAMAFAVAMIVFSTITTGIVELLLRLAGTREKNLEKTIRVLFKTVIWPRMKEPLMEAAAKADEVVKAAAKDAEGAVRDKLGDKFVDAMMGNPIAGGSGAEIPVRKESQVSELSVLAFAERLGRTDAGKAILAQGEDQLKLLVTDFARTFDRFARASREVFRKRAQQTAMAVGIVFALAANVDAGRLFVTLMDNPDLRTGLIEQVDGAAEANKAVTDRLAELTAKLDEDGLDEEQSALIKANLDEITANIEALESELGASGLPIGYRYYPYCSDGPVDGLGCGPADTGPLSFLQWLVLAIVAGILIGLGGPFWFGVFSSLSQVFQVLRSLGIGRGGAGKQAQPEGEVAAAPPAEDSAKPTSVVDAFVVAAQVHVQTEGAGQSTEPNAEGEPA